MIDRLLAIGGLTGTVVFGLLSVFFYLRPPRRRRLDAAWSAALLQTRRHPRVRMYFDETEVEAISRIRVVFRSSGTEAVRNSDISPTRPLIITTAGGKILSAACIAGDADETSSLCCVVSPDTAAYTFSYLNPSQAVVVELLVSGEAAPTIGGRIIGGDLAAFEVATIRFKSSLREVFDWCINVVIVSFFIYSWLRNPNASPLLIVRGVLVMMLVYMIGYYFDRRRFRRRLAMFTPLLDNKTP